MDYCMRGFQAALAELERLPKEKMEHLCLPDISPLVSKVGARPSHVKVLRAKAGLSSTAERVFSGGNLRFGEGGGLREIAGRSKTDPGSDFDPILIRFRSDFDPISIRF